MRGISIIVAGLFVCNAAFAALGTDMSNQNTRSESSSDSQKSSATASKNISTTKSETKNVGDEISHGESITRNLSETRTITKNVTRSENGAWSISLSPVAYLLMQLKQIGWDFEAFHLIPKDLGVSYFIDEDEDIIDVNKKKYMESKAQMQSSLTPEQQKRVENAVLKLYITSQLLERAIASLTASNQFLNLENIKNMSLLAIKKAYENKNFDTPNIYDCRWGGNQNTFICNNGEWTLIVNPSIPQLLHFGTAVYSANQVGHSTPMLTFTVANNDSDAMSIASADSQSKATTDAIRAYTSKLSSEGKSAVASKIVQVTLEKAFTQNIGLNHTDVMQAINANSPAQLLSIFK